MLILAVGIGFWVATPSSGVRAAEADDMTETLGALDPKKLAAECRARETRAREALAQSRELLERRAKLRKEVQSLYRKRNAYLKRIDDLKNKIHEKYMKYEKMLFGQNKKQFTDKIIELSEEDLRKKNILNSILEPDWQYVDSLEKNYERVSKKWWAKDQELQKITSQLQSVLFNTELPWYEDSPNELDEAIRYVSERCRTLERLARLTEGLLGEEEAEEDQPSADDETGKAPETPPAERKRELKEDEAPKAETPPPGRETKLKEDQEPEPERAEPDPEAGARADIAEARRYYNEARAFDVENKKEHAAESYRVAMSLLAEAKEKSQSEERQRKIDKVMANLSKRITDLPGEATPQDKQARAEPAQRTLREQGNAECAAKFRNAVVLKPKSGAGGFWCVCRKGHTWNKSQTACIKAPSQKEAGRTACARRYRNSIYVGMKNGLAQCRCPKGRQFNADRTACVRTPRTQTSRRQLTPGQRRELARRQGEAAYNLGVLLGQALRSRERSRSSHVRRPPAHRATPRQQAPGSSWRDRFGKRQRMTPEDHRRYRGGTR